MLHINRSRLLIFALSWLTGGTVSLAADAPADLASRPARSSPDWLTKGVIYQVWLRGFTPERTLQAATRRLPQVAELGANIIYLCPICFQDADMRPEFWSARQKASGTNNPRNPYRIADYNRVDPEYGTEADLREFITTAHRLKLRVLMDLVYFHCGPTAVLIDRPGFVQRDAAGNPATGSWHFPILNFKCPELREYLWANMLHWVRDFEVDGYRCDVADAVPLDFWEEGRRRLEAIRPDVVMLSEGQRKADQLSAFDLNYGFSWIGATRDVLSRGEPATRLRQIWQEQAAQRPRGARFMRYTENHDIVNDLLRAEVMFGEGAAMAMSVINFTMDGVPLLYNGQEIGDTSLQSIYARWPVRWEAACLPKSAAKLAVYKKLCDLRRGRPALATGQVIWLDNDQPDSVVSFLRQTKDEQILSVVSLTSHKLEVRLVMPEKAAVKYEPLLFERATLADKDVGVAVKLGSCGYVVAARR